MLPLLKIKRSCDARPHPTDLPIPVLRKKATSAAKENIFIYLILFILKIEILSFDQLIAKAAYHLSFGGGALSSKRDGEGIQQDKHTIYL